MSLPVAGEIVVVDWRGGALPTEPTKIRPCVVVQDESLFADDEPTTIIVPLTTSLASIDPAFALQIEPSVQNGCTATSWALAHHVCVVSLERIIRSPSRVTSAQLAEIRSRIALALGLT
ncbi:MAG: type II toxin-antitoxin system PemK/MazF family toxin [Chloroflexi bacterium]|nr:type II toxin-antitoxin system PemK/MazF family toxin [Chloroflexota bacterium]